MSATAGRLAAVELVDAHLCSDASKFLAALLLSLSSMMHLELPHINVLSKADLVETYGELHFNLDFYTEVRQHSVLLTSRAPCNRKISIITVEFFAPIWPGGRSRALISFRQLLANGACPVACMHSK